MMRWIQLSVLVIAIGSVPMTAWAFSSGPPDGIAGEPPLQSDCTLCHTSFDVNSGDGALDLTTANFNSNTISVLLGNGYGSYADKFDYATDTGPYSVYQHAQHVNRAWFQ